MAVSIREVIFKSFAKDFMSLRATLLFFVAKQSPTLQEIASGKEQVRPRNDICTSTKLPIGQKQVTGSVSVEYFSRLGDVGKVAGDEVIRH